MSTYAFAPWAIGPDRSDEETVSPLRQIECTTCREKSEADAQQFGSDTWAISHAARTGHLGFREVVTALLRVVPAPGNPHYGKEAQR
ncbi:hypothetical protein SAZ_34035 [Streptomyces noursei ZPM]|uniref:DUF7848 domain-containing protein n=1 Tax=Streptomyces noursei TaxID=1971 RepID=A0A401RAS5_STRNR|nr:hypothetical protein [Streptomyces noursei]AKA06871.1 hypothetical protein SAZ_34035 [Streptomyces noursei ZPM]EOS98428.1 hypothetical protein K530_39036 [Streptomyces noursei CCRC 11814]EXU91959.1 hypothetical protein P354_32530 [Streptomyces noursei PD-1]UWS75405.1 hypothetical protein N1H47_31750 [Streptomyces noursei]GCB94704.1 hypothetical protein SALB_07505 [Streptomyces noursei]